MKAPNDDELIAEMLEKLRERDPETTLFEDWDKEAAAHWFEDWDKEAAAHWWRAIDRAYNRRIALMRARPLRGRHRPPINAFIAYGGIKTERWLDQRILVSMTA